MTQELTLSEFMKHLVTLFHENEIPMPLKDERPWHMLFYHLKRHEPNKPNLGFLRRLRFDWDGQYPRCQEVSDFLRALHWNAGVSATNPHYATITLPEEVAELWSSRCQQLEQNVRATLSEVVEMARKDFQAA